MIIVRLSGGMGNQLFQYAAGKALAEKKNTELFFDTSGLNSNLPGVTKRSYELGVFNISSKIAAGTLVEHKNSFNWLRGMYDRLQPYYRKKIYREHYFQYDDNFTKASSHTILDGYWQSEKYFKSISGIIRDELQITAALSKATCEAYDSIKGTNSVSMHIRRGDYVTDPATSKMHGNCGLDYYEKALIRMGKSIGSYSLFIFSDDMLWVKENFKTDHPVTFIDHTDELHAYEDLYLMSHCKHNIIANSSFSWWAAWLNRNDKKIVIAPSKWFNEFNATTEDLLPAEWIQL